MCAESGSQCRPQVMRRLDPHNACTCEFRANMDSSSPHRSPRTSRLTRKARMLKQLSLETLSESSEGYPADDVKRSTMRFGLRRLFSGSTCRFPRPLDLAWSSPAIARQCMHFTPDKIVARPISDGQHASLAKTGNDVDASSTTWAPIN